MRIDLDIQQSILILIYRTILVVWISIESINVTLYTNEVH